GGCADSPLTSPLRSPTNRSQTAAARPVTRGGVPGLKAPDRSWLAVPSSELPAAAARGSVHAPERDRARRRARERLGPHVFIVQCAEPERRPTEPRPHARLQAL